MILLHPSSLGRIMADAVKIDPLLFNEETLAISKKKVKTDADKEILKPLWERTLSVGAKTFLKDIAKQEIYGVKFDIDNVKYIQKGNACEQAAIDLLNSILFKRYTKNVERISTDLMSGECDILVPKQYVRDTKAPWSLQSFPCVKEDAADKDYEWQGRGYMHLYDVPLFHLDYLLVTTPEELRKYEPANIHEVDHIDPALRHTTISYTRDMELERKMLVKCAVAQEYCEKVKHLILSEREIS